MQSVASRTGTCTDLSRFGLRYWRHVTRFFLEFHLWSHDDDYYHNPKKCTTWTSIFFLLTLKQQVGLGPRLFNVHLDVHSIMSEPMSYIKVAHRWSDQADGAIRPNLLGRKSHPFLHRWRWVKCFIGWSGIATGMDPIGERDSLHLIHVYFKMGNVSYCSYWIWYFNFYA